MIYKSIFPSHTVLLKGVVMNKKDKPIILDVTFSPEIAADLKAKKIRAFAPMSAAELIWLEALEAIDTTDS